MGRRPNVLAGMPPLREWWRTIDRLEKKQARAESEHQAALLAGRKAKRPKCYCAAYPWPHRPTGGLCRSPEAPVERWQGKAGNNAPAGMRRSGSIRRELMRRHKLHPIRDREKVRRWLPKLYAAYCRRHGLPYCDWWLGGYVPAMRVTADGAPACSVPLDPGRDVARGARPPKTRACPLRNTEPERASCGTG